MKHTLPLPSHSRAAGLGVITGVLALTAIITAASDSPNPRPKPPPIKPNILFILADDLGYGDVGCYNTESKVATPNLDRLAREGMRFTDAHAPSTVCTPSRYSLLTGRMAFRINYRSVFEGVGGPCLIKEDQLTLPQMLRNQGYATAMTGIRALDSIVGDLMKTLEQLGLADNTVVMFSSDNGPEVESVVHMRADYGHDGARPWRGVKRDQWEGGHRVPFIVRWPGKIAAASTSNQTVCLTDVMATCAAMTGAALPDKAAEDSFDLLPVLLGKANGTAARAYTLHQTISLALAIRRGPWKYLDHRGSGGNNYDQGELKPFALPDTAPDAPGQLYNLETDPGEKVNLYFKHPEMVKELKALLNQSKAAGRSRPERPATTPPPLHPPME